MSAVNCAMRSTMAVKVDGRMAEQKDKIKQKQIDYNLYIKQTTQQTPLYRVRCGKEAFLYILKRTLILRTDYFIGGAMFCF